MPDIFDDERYDIRSEARSNAADEVADNNRQACIESCIKNCEGFDWRWRIVQAADTPEKKKACQNLSDWCEEQLKEEWNEQADAAAFASNPDKYYGVNASDFR